MKKTKFFFLLTLIMLFLVSCSLRFPKAASYYTSPFELTDEEKLWRASLALSPDGSSIVVDGKYLANLVTGEREDLYERFKVGRDTTLKAHDILNHSAYWSFDGRYLGMLADHYEPTSVSAEGEVTYIFDLQDNTFRRYDMWSSAFSPFNSNQILTSKGVYNLNDGTIIPFSPDYDFRQEKEFGATGYPINFFLWGKNLGIPIAQISKLPHNTIEKEHSEVVVKSFDWYHPVPPAEIAYTVSTGFVSKRPNRLSGYFFDPTGEYILISEWQCHEGPTPCTVTPVYVDNVYDTILTLVRWRTGEQKELIKLSEIDSENVIAYGYMAWSTDGSTIYISRHNAQPVVLKVKYP